MKKFLFASAFALMGTFALANETKTEVIEKSEELATIAESQCFDFNDSCGGSWEVCHENVSTAQLIDFLWNWDGGC